MKKFFLKLGIGALDLVPGGNAAKEVGVGVGKLALSQLLGESEEAELQRSFADYARDLDGNEEIPNSDKRQYLRDYVEARLTKYFGRSAKPHEVDAHSGLALIEARGDERE